MRKEEQRSQEFCLITTAVATQTQANELANALVTNRLAACVQVLPITSTYTWKDQLHQEPEYLLLIKTTARLYIEVEKAILELHSYELPEIMQIPVTAGYPPYLDWIRSSCKK